MKCKALRTDGKTRCKAWAIRGKDVCRVHGGATPVKHGLYSKYAPLSLKKMIDEADINSEAENIDDQIRFQNALLLQRLSDLKTKAGVLNDEEIINLLKISQAISNSIEKKWKIEKVGMELLDGMSYVEIISKIQELWSLVFNVIRVITNDTNVERKNIADEVAKRIRERIGADNIKKIAN